MPFNDSPWWSLSRSWRMLCSDSPSSIRSRSRARSQVPARLRSPRSPLLGKSLDLCLTTLLSLPSLRPRVQLLLAPLFVVAVQQPLALERWRRLLLVRPQCAPNPPRAHLLLHASALPSTPPFVVFPSAPTPIGACVLFVKDRSQSTTSTSRQLDLPCKTPIVNTIAATFASISKRTPSRKSRRRRQRSSGAYSTSTDTAAAMGTATSVLASSSRPAGSARFAAPSSRRRRYATSIWRPPSPTITRSGSMRAQSLSPGMDSGSPSWPSSFPTLLDGRLVSLALSISLFSSSTYR